MSKRVQCELPPINRKDLAARVAEKAGLTDMAAAAAVSAVVEAMTDALLETRGLELRGFGTIQVVMNEARKGRNPRKPDQVYVVPARIGYKFVPGSLLRGGNPE